jgi:PKD repeat protein
MRHYLLCCFAVLSIAAAQAQTYYVAPTGLDTNPGTSSLPFREIRKGLTVVVAGDTILVADGQYLGFDVKGLQGTAANPITIKATGSNAVVNVTIDRPDNRDTIFITLDANTGTIPSTYIVIDGLTSFNANRAAMRIDQCPHITVRNCTFGNNATWGLFTDFSDYLLIENNNCYGSVVQHGCYVSNTCTGPIVRGNQFHDNYGCGLHMNGDVSQGGVGIITNALIEKNIIYGNGAGGGSGINCDGVQSSVFQNNLVYNAHAAGISLYMGDASQTSDNNLVVNNTFDIASDGKWGIQLHNGSKNNTVFNNIVVTQHPWHGSIHIDSAASMVGLVCDYNVLTTNNDCVTTDGDTSYLSFAQWKTQGFDTHSLTATQSTLFVNSGSGDYHLVNGSPAIDKGVATLNGKTPPPDDRDGNPRPSGAAYDIGAFELQSGVLTITTSSPLPAGTVGTSYSQAFGANGGPAPYMWTISAGTLPDGLSFSAAGVLSGTPTSAGTSNFTVQVTDNSSATKTKAFALTINSTGSSPPPPPPPPPGGGGSTPPSVNSPPGASTSPIVVNVPVTFSAGATDPTGGTLTYQWNFGDGSSGSGSSATHTYTAPGSYTVTVTITSSNGGVTTSTLNINVQAAMIPMSVAKMQGAVKFSAPSHDTVSVSGTIPNLPKLFDPTGQTLIVNVSGASVTFTLDSKGRGKTAQGSIALKLKPSVRNKATSKMEFQGGNVTFTLKLQHGTWAAAWGMNSASTVSNSPMPLDAQIQLAGNTYDAPVTVQYSGKAHVSGKFKK